jgi:putative transposase
VTDNGGPFRSFRFEAFIATHPELRHVRTRVRSPGQNGSRERGFGTLNYERLFLEEIDDVLDLTIHAERYRIDYNAVRPHEALSWNRPTTSTSAWPTRWSPTFPSPKSCQLLDAEHHYRSSTQLGTSSHVMLSARCLELSSAGHQQIR